jgi:SAM-dependent methyltransferase
MAKHTLARIEFALQGLLRSTPRCPHCGSLDTPVIRRKYRVIKIRECASCALKFTDPIYRSWLSSRFYDRFYSEGDWTTRIPTDSELAALRESRFVGTNKDFGERIGQIRRWAPGERWLELGTSWGYFLEQARWQGIHGAGIELSGPRGGFAREVLKLDVRPSIDAHPKASFDLVYSAHVLEHFTDLTSILPALRDRLKPGGKWLVEVPNVDLAQFGEDALYHIGAVHPLGFSRQFFAKRLPELGFVDVHFPANYAALGAPDDPLKTPGYLIVAATLQR